MRKMATIRKIDALRPIEGADAIECAVVGGWTVVVKKGEYAAGDLAVYCEIDSFIPTDIAPFLTKPGHYAKTFDGVEGEQLRTVKLRGQLSQGLLLPVVNDVTGTYLMIYTDETGEYSLTVAEGDDVSTVLGIAKYEAPIPAALAGEVRGMFPSVVPKTDQERIQNLSAELKEWLCSGLTWEVTEKLEGSSMTVYVMDGEVGVCSRNLDLKRNPDNSLWRAAIKYGLEEKLVAAGRNIAIQGELIGNGVQGNIYKERDQDYYVYDIYDIDAGRYFTPTERMGFVTQNMLTHCPVLMPCVEFDTETVESLLKMAEGETAMLGSNCQREGIVFKCHEQAVSFKAISNRYLLKHGG
jgi:RNA ligase (TIGR02306 family)